MKKVLLICLLIIAAVAFFSCSDDTQPILPETDSQPVPPENVITVSELAAEQQEIIYMLSRPYFEMYLYDFNTDETYSNIEVWVEEYQNGELIDCPVKVSMVLRGNEKHNGHIAIVVNQQLYHQWTLTVIENEFESSVSESDFGTAEIISDSADRVFGPIEESVSIDDEKEIIVYRSLYTAGNHGYDCQTLQENPELLKEYPVAYVIKCKFSNNSNS